MIRRIQIDGYKSLNNFSIQLKPLTIFFGPNAAGKSNFLDALQLLSRMASGKTLKEAFEPPYRGRPIESFSFLGKGIEGMIEQESLKLWMSVDIELSDFLINKLNLEISALRYGIEPKNGEMKEISVIKEKFLRYRIEFEFLPKHGFLRVRNERLCALKSDLSEKESRNAFLEVKDQRLSLRMEGQAHPVYYEIGLDHTILSLPLYPPHYPHLTAVKRELENWRFFYFEPRERMRAANPTKEINNVGMMGEDLAAYLNTIKGKDFQRFIAIGRAVHNLIPSIEQIDTEINKKTGEVELLVYENNIPVSARLLSEGTLRLIGLLSITGGENSPTVVCFEEPENGIHPQRIEMIAEYLKAAVNDNSQIIVTTHSPILPDHIENESLFVCTKKGRNTTIRPFTEIGLFRKQGIHQGLNQDAVLPSELIMRGDLNE